MREIKEKADTEDLSGDLFIFYFSGHAFANPYNDGTGLTLLATPATAPEITPENAARTTLSSGELIPLINGISAQKLIVIDACRNLPPVGRLAPFHSGALTDEFSRHVIATHFYFSTKDGSPSIEEGDFAFDSNRPAGLRGNGLFTYGMLTALHSTETELPGEISAKGQLDADAVYRYLRRSIFDLRNPESILRRLQQTHAGVVEQVPDYIPGRPAHLVIRVNR